MFVLSYNYGWLVVAKSVRACLNNYIFFYFEAFGLLFFRHEFYAFGFCCKTVSKSKLMDWIVAHCMDKLSDSINAFK